MIVSELFCSLGLVPDEKSWDKGHELVESLHHAVEAYLGFEGLKKVKELVEGTVEAAVHAKHLGEQLGISAEAVQELGYAADVTGASAEDMRGAMQRLSRGLEQAKKGGGPVVDAFSKLHIKMQDIKGESLDANLEVIADRFAKMPDGAEKAALAMELFGRQGTRLIPLLNKGQAGIVELREEAEKLGVVMGEEAVEKAEEFEISQKKLHATLAGVRNEAVTAVLPALTEMAEALGEWVKENREAITSTLKAVLTGIATAFHVVGEAIGAVLEIIDYLSDHLDLLISIISGVAAVLLPFVAGWAAEMAIAAAETLLAAAPFIAIGVAVAALTFGIIKLIEHWGQIWGWVKSKGEEFASWFGELPDRIGGWVDDIAESIKQAFQDAWDYVVRGAKQAWQEIKDTPIIGHIIKAGGAIADLFSGSDSATQLPQFTQNLLGVQPSVGAGTSGGNTYAPQFGDITVQVDATNVDEDAVGEVVAGKVREHQQDMVREAYAMVSGGRR